MKQKFEFNIESLLHGIEYPKGKIEHMLFAEKVAHHEGMDFFNRLAQVSFLDSRINKAFAGGVRLDETLLIGLYNYEVIKLHLCIRSGQSCCKIATADSRNRKVKIYKDYRDVILMRKLTDNHIFEIFNFVWGNLEILYPNPKPLDEDF
ncbi:hypothetical protein [Sphingobacterium siyangense]|uniref:hypothetical protein n=1 Tax=Sphingobacterium siyangense TaxID=459529 RepID=UPI002FDD72F2